MLTDHIRAATPEELAALEALINRKPISRGSVARLVFVRVLILLLLSASWCVLFPLKLASLPGLVVGVLSAVVLMFVSLFFYGDAAFQLSQRRHRIAFEKTALASMQSALATAQVRATDVEASAVIELEQFEDEGEGYVFDVGGQQCLILKGQTYWPHNTERAWPATAFSIVRTPEGNHWLGLFVTGQPLEPIRRIDPKHLREEFVFADLEELRGGSLQDVVKSLCREDAA